MLNRRLVFLALIGAGGCAVLIALGFWQVQRLAWKEALLDGIESRIAAEPVPLPATPDPAADRYLPVVVEGTFRPRPAARMLASRRNIGAVHRHIRPFETVSGRVVLVDLGWTPADRDLGPLPGGPVTLTGNLDWPNEADWLTPAPDVGAGLWFARDVPAMAANLGTEPVLIVLRDLKDTTPHATPWPVDTAGIPNDHLQYAITWFSLAAIWAAMSLTFLLRGTRGRKKS